MDEFSNQLIEAPEDEDIDELNDETFGDSAENCADWEQSHEELACVSFGGHNYSRGNADEFDFDDMLGMQETEALAQHLSELVVEDDEDVDQLDSEISKRHGENKPSVDLDHLFGPHSPPGLFDAEERAMGQPNIWGSPARDSFLQSQANVPVNNLLQSVLYKMPAVLSGNRAGIPNGAKTLEEIEQSMIGGINIPQGQVLKPPPRVLTVEELERQLRGEDIGRLNNDVANNNELENQYTHIPRDSKGMSIHPESRSHPIPMPQRPLVQPSGSMRASTTESPTGNALRMPPPHSGSPSGMMWPQGMKMPPRPLGNPALHQQMMTIHGMNLRYPLGMPQAHMFPPMGLKHGYMRPTVDNVLYNQHRRGGPVGNNPAYMNLLRPSHGGSQPMPFPSNMRMAMPVKAAFPLQRQQLFQQQQMMMMMMRQGATARFQPGMGGVAGMPYPGRQLYDPDADTRAHRDGVDEYAGLMTQREKDWVVKIQLLQLHTDNPYVDDYYFTCWSLKKMLRERKKREGVQNKENESEPALVLPQLAKVETKAYTPAQFEGALGRLTAASIHNPRKMISIDIAAGQESDEARGIEVKRFKEILLRIEKAYDSLLDIEDIEKKAMAQPPEIRQSLYDERAQLIKQLYRRLKGFSSESHVEKETATGEEGLMQMIGIRKGMMLILRLLPLLDKVDSQAVTSLVLRKMAAKKDWQSEVLPAVFRAICQVIESANLQELVTLAAALTSSTEQSGISTPTADKNAINRLVIAMQSKFGLSAILCLINRGEVICTTESPLDLDVEHQNDWRQFVETTASALELCDKSSLVQPLASFPLVLAHFRRILDKRWMLVIEDKLEIVAATISPSDMKTSVT